jgi:autotransporter-associated beta strand repeat
MKIPSAFAAAFAVACSSTLTAATVTWTAGGNGNIGDPTKYVGGVAPVDGDTVVSDGTGSVIDFNNTNSGLSLTQMDLNWTSGATQFNQTGGTFTIGTLRFSGSSGASRNPTYNLNAGTVNISTLTWGAGNNANFNVNGGTANYSGSALTIGSITDSNGKLNVTAGSFSHTGTGQIQLGQTNNGKGSIIMSGGSFTSDTLGIRLGNANHSGNLGTIALSGNASFTADSATTVYLGNNSGNGVITLADTASLSVAAAEISVGQYRTGTVAENGQRGGTLTMSGTSTLTAKSIFVGGANAASEVNGVINLNGGTISAEFVRKGFSSLTPSATQLVLNGNGGTIRATAAQGDYFSSLYVNLQAGGLKFNTNSNAVTITAATTITGTGDFVKQGAGALTIFGSKTYTGDTVIEGGSLVLGNSDVFDAGSSLVLDGGTLALADFNQSFATLNLESTSTIDFGTLLGGSNTLTFGDSSAVAWSGSLILTNFNVGEDALNFSSAAGLNINQLSAISLAGYTATGLDSLGNVVFTAVPEPAEISLAIAAGLGLVAMVRRRRARLG